MKSTITGLLVTACLVLSQIAQAHPGHDHSHWMSGFIHLVTVLAVGGVVVTGVFVFKQYIRRENFKKER